MKFGWVPDPFDAGSTARMRKDEMSKMWGEKMNPKPFNPANVKKLEKYEFSFLAEHEKSL